MLNKVILIGRITKDVELRRTNNNTPVTSFTLAVDKRFSKQEDSNQNSADFINCVAWNRIAEVMDQYVVKGMLLAIEGRIQTRSYENSEGVRIYTTEVVCNNMQMLESKNSRDKNNNYSSNKSYNTEEEIEETKEEENEDFEIDDDELPF